MLQLVQNHEGLTRAGFKGIIIISVTMTVGTEAGPVKPSFLQFKVKEVKTMFALCIVLPSYSLVVLTIQL